jgi:hypothetical protein
VQLFLDSLNRNYNIYSQKGLEKNADFGGSKVFVKMKKGQKKCPFFENGKESWKSLFSEPL